MAVRALDQILSELSGVYDPQINSIRQQQAALPGQMQAEEAGLQAKQTQAFDDILGGARRRGMGFSGIPLGEQAKYTATEYLPAIARLRQASKTQATSLEDMINQINERRTTTALGLRQQDIDNDYRERQFAAAQAESAAARGASGGGGGFSPSFGGGAEAAAKGAGSAQMQQRGDKGFNFQYNGRPISAAQFAQSKGVPFRTLLQQMANAGDAGAKHALGIVGNDFGFNRKALGKYKGGVGAELNLLRALGLRV
jgi:hypothetical protein